MGDIEDAGEVDRDDVFPIRAAPSMPLRRAMPALLTSTVTAPTLSATCFATAMQSSRLVTSSTKLSAAPPASRISRAASAAACSLMSSSTTRALSRA